MTPDEVISQLGYKLIPENWVSSEQTTSSESQLWRAAKDCVVHGSYVFRTSPGSDNFLPPRPAIHVVEARDAIHAREIHRKLWNLGTAPFVLIILPGQVRVYAGFNYSVTHPDAGYIARASLDPEDIRVALRDFYAHEID